MAHGNSSNGEAAAGSGASHPDSNAFFGYPAGGQTFTLDQVKSFVRQTGPEISAANIKKYVEDRVDALAADAAITDEHKTALKRAMLKKMGFDSLVPDTEYTWHQPDVFSEVDAFLVQLNHQASSYRVLYNYVIAQPGVQLGALPDVIPQQGVNAEQSKGFWGDTKWTAQGVKDTLSIGGGYSDPEKTMRDRNNLRSFVRQRVDFICGDSQLKYEIREALVNKLAIPADSESHTLSSEQACVIEQLANVKNDIQLQMIVKDSFWPTRDIQDVGFFTLEHANRDGFKEFVRSRLDALMEGHITRENDQIRAKNAVLHHLGFAVETTADRALTDEEATQAFEDIKKLTTPQAIGFFAVNNLAPLDKLASDVRSPNRASDKWVRVQSFLANKMVEKDTAGRVTQDLAMAQTEALKPYFMKRFFGSFRRDAQRDLRTIVKNFVDNIPTAQHTTIDLNNVDATNWYQRMQLANQARSKAGVSAQQCADYCETVAVLKESGDQGKLRSKLQAIQSRYDGGYAELALIGLQSTESGRVLGAIQSKFQRDADPVLKAKHDANLRLQQTAAGKYQRQESGWGYCDSPEEAGDLAIALDGKQMPLADVIVVSAKYENDPLSVGLAFENTAWAELEIGDVTISAPGEDADCNSIQAYMLHAKRALEGESKWNKANQEAVYAYAMEHFAEKNDDFAQSCMDVQNTHSGKKWVLTPSARKALGVDEGFSLEAARQQAFKCMQASLDCRFIHELKDYRIPSQSEGAGLTTAPSDEILAKLQKYPPLQAEFWRQYWARVFEKPSYALDKQGQPQVSANLDGSTVLHYGKGVFAKVNHDGCSKSNGIHSQEEADGLVTAMLQKRRIDGKSEKPDQPLMAYGKSANAIKYLLIACRNNNVRVRIDPTNLVAKSALKKCSQAVQNWVNGNVAYRYLASESKGGAMPVHAAGTPPMPGPGPTP